MAKKKSNELVTKIMLDEAVETILDGVNDLYTKHDKRLDTIESDIHFIKHDVRDIKTQISDMPSGREFSDLKRKVDSLQV